MGSYKIPKVSQKQERHADGVETRWSTHEDTHRVEIRETRSTDATTHSSTSHSTVTSADGGRPRSPRRSAAGNIRRGSHSRRNPETEGCWQCSRYPYQPN